MVAVAVGASASTTRAALTAFVAQAGILVDPVALSWQVNRITTDTERLAPAPATGGAGTVNLTTDRIGEDLGHFGAAWTVSGTETLGCHEIIWSATFADGSVATWRREFDVLAAVGTAGQPGYALVSDFRAEGFLASIYPDAKIMLKIKRWSDYIDRVCDRFFEPRAKVIAIDGTGRKAIGLDDPIIALADVSILNETIVAGPVDMTALRVYNRHLTEGLTDPDDRNAPRLEWVTIFPSLVSSAYSGYNVTEAMRWPIGEQNIQITGLFGYTDPDGSPTGETPELVRHVTKLLVVRDLPLLSDKNGRQDARERVRITSERTREQSYTLGARGDRSPAALGSAYFTGDPEIDDILESLAAPPRMGST